MSTTVSENGSLGQIAVVHSQAAETIPAALQAQAQQAWEKFTATGFPHAKAEEYKYTPITKQLDRHFDLSALAPQGVVSEAEVKSLVFQSVEADLFVLVNGRFNEALSNYEGKGYDVCTLAEADEELVQEVIAKHKPQDDPFIHLNNAMASEGLFIHVPKNTQLQKPIIILNVTDSRHGQVVSHARNIIIAEQGAEAVIIEQYKSLGAVKSLTNNVTELFAEANAHLSFYKFQQENDSAFHLGNILVYQTKDSEVTTFTMTLEGAMIRNNLTFLLDGENITSNMYGLSFLKGKSHVDHHTVVDHTHPHCDSNELYKGVFDDKSAGVFNGKIFVREGAQKTNAFQSNKNILLSDDASIDTKPQLEIWADDVKCSHGCTNGQLDPEQLFYLRARGVDKRTAQGMLLYGFAADVLENIKLESLREELADLIHDRAGF
ncbi:Fe-S cluster assembly protein SufD [Persicobacter psychrovividus]|uniref:Fe-S cluster assembly protein SufD n=1 Tax=Persicobacter psychrovividus TaxID=387638 RepID=A0ABM7VDQ4_9BACT|nr:Fe-S cluster assembly protein SufD [Persicobacter psychrovividus]